MNDEMNEYREQLRGYMFIVRWSTRAFIVIVLFGFVMVMIPWD